MRPPRKKTKRRKAKESSPPEPMSLKDKLQIWALVTGLILASALYFHFIATTKQRQALDDLLGGWRRDYHLSEEQSRQIRAIEEDFHGSGNPFLRPAHTAAETRDHHRIIAAKMNPEDGSQFLRSQEGFHSSR